MILVILLPLNLEVGLGNAVSEDEDVADHRTHKGVDKQEERDLYE